MRHRHAHRKDGEDDRRPGAPLRLFIADAKARPVATIAASVGGVADAIQRRQIAHFVTAEPGGGTGAAQALSPAI